MGITLLQDNFIEADPDTSNDNPLQLDICPQPQGGFPHQTTFQ